MLLLQVRSHARLPAINKVSENKLEDCVFNSFLPFLRYVLEKHFISACVDQVYTGIVTQYMQQLAQNDLIWDSLFVTHLILLSLALLTELPTCHVSCAL